MVENLHGHKISTAGAVLVPSWRCWFGLLRLSRHGSGGDDLGGAGAAVEVSGPCLINSAIVADGCNPSGHGGGQAARDAGEAAAHVKPDLQAVRRCGSDLRGGV